MVKLIKALFVMSMIRIADAAFCSFSPCSTNAQLKQQHRHLCNAIDLSADGAVDNLGLLNQVDVTKDKYYTSNLCVEGPKDLSWLYQQGLAWKAAQLDARTLGHASTLEYLKGVMRAMETFSSTGIVHDREDLLKFIDLTVDQKAFRLLLGGKSVGKSLVLRNFWKQANNGDKLDKNGRKIAVLYINGRSKSQAPIRAALCAGWQRLAADFPGIFGQEDRNKVVESVEKIIRTLRTEGAAGLIFTADDIWLMPARSSHK